MGTARAARTQTEDIPEPRRISRISLREQVLRVLRADIVSGALEPGAIYSASVIANRLGVSATPIREAMLDLAKAGLVEPIRNRGFRVLTLSEQDLDEIVSLRMMLEPPAVRIAVERASTEELAALEPFVDDIEAAARAGDTSAFLIADQEFHLGLLRLTGNGRLVALVSELRDQTQLRGLRALAEGGELLASATEHRAILEACTPGEADRAEALMRYHLEHTRGIWAGRSEDPPSSAPATTSVAT